MNHKEILENNVFDKLMTTKNLHIGEYNIPEQSNLYEKINEHTLINKDDIYKDITYQHIQKINKHIEIVIVPKRVDSSINRENIGIELKEDVIFDILTKSYQNVFITIIKNETDLKSLISRKPNLVFSGVKYFDFEKRTVWLSDYLKKHNISYITSSKEALNNEYNKNIAKDIMIKANIPTAKYFITQPHEHPTEESIPISYPLFLKPITGGDSRGINEDSIVFDFKSFQSKVLDIYQSQKSRTLVETYLSGKEYSVSILENSIKNTFITMPIEIIANKNKNGHRILDYEIKKYDLEKVIAVTNKIIHSEISTLAIDSFNALGGKTMGRIDLKMDHNGIPHFIEANLMPGLGKGYFYRSFVINKNKTYEEMILLIAEAGLLK